MWNHLAISRQWEVPRRHAHQWPVMVPTHQWYHHQGQPEIRIHKEELEGRPAGSHKISIHCICKIWPRVCLLRVGPTPREEQGQAWESPKESRLLISNQYGQDMSVTSLLNQLPLQSLDECWRICCLIFKYNDPESACSGIAIGFRSTL